MLVAHVGSEGAVGRDGRVVRLTVGASGTHDHYRYSVDTPQSSFSA